MRGERCVKTEYGVEPIRVITRQSTEWVAIADQKMAAALRYIRQHAHERDLRVADIARSVGLSRRATEIRFRAATGRTLRGEIEHVRLERLRALLTESDATIGACTEACGFAGQTHAGRVFRQRFGMTMGQWRKGQ